MADEKEEKGAAAKGDTADKPVKDDKPEKAPAAPAVQNVQTSSSDAVQYNGFDGARTAGGAAAVAEGAAPLQAAATSKPQTVVKDDFSKTPRNAPCPCGSGKKFKQRQGAA